MANEKLSRRQRKYINRKNNRLKKKLDFINKYNDFSMLTDYYNLLESTKMAARHVMWKISVQKFIKNDLLKVYNLRSKLLKRQDIRTGFITFPLFERGKARTIRAVHFSERIVQKTLCQKILYPLYTHYVIEDNYANQKYKGIAYAMKRFDKSLVDYMKKNGRDGYILFIDFKNYFGSIPHDKLKVMVREYITNEDLLHYIDWFIDAYGDIGLGLGSETSQLHGMMYPTKLDHFIKEQLGVKYYGRYMDDSYIIGNDKKELEKILDRIVTKAKEYDITINLKKTKIKDLKHGFKYLKTRYFITKTCKLIKRANKYMIKHECKKLLKLINITSIHNNEIRKDLYDWIGMSLSKSKNSRYKIWKIRDEIDTILKTRLNPKKEKSWYKLDYIPKNFQ